MMIIALTGGIGSGKTTVTDLFRSLDVPIIDTDIIARKIVERGKPAYQSIINYFGEEILHKDKTVNRSTLRNIIFSSKTKRQYLEKLLHPRIWEEVKKLTLLLDTDYCIVVIPLLVENKTQAKPIILDRILVIDSEEETQIQRSIQRDNCNKESIKKIIESQVSREERNNAADDIILNNSDTDALLKKVETLHKKYLELAK